MRKCTVFGWLKKGITFAEWSGKTLSEIASTDFRRFFATDAARLGFHLPVTVVINGTTLPGCFVDHHACHAASVFYGSPFEEAAIFTHDGYSWGDSYQSGMCYSGRGNRLFPITPHHVVIGSLYDQVGHFLGLGDVGPAGKLMGLAAYGTPVFFDQKFVGNWYDYQRMPTSAGDGNIFYPWMQFCILTALSAGYDVSAVCTQSNDASAVVNDRFARDIAASAQKLFEEVILKAVAAMQSSFKAAGVVTNNLCLSGGTALNCPANGRLHREGPYANVFVEPGCDDSGIAIGAAKFVAHNVFDLSRPNAEQKESKQSSLSPPYLGISPRDDAIETALLAVSSQVDVASAADPALAAAKDIAADLVIAWFEGRSEIGPRALGHRSILADARKAENWKRVNLLKGRELWRPLAPAVLASEAHHWFGGIPLPSPYMLFTGKVCSDQLPAITHVDGTTRLQTVDPSCGTFYNVLLHFFRLTGIPVVLNTSFNGPGEPIVETPADAIRFLVNFPLDALYIGGRRVVRRKRLGGTGILPVPHLG